MLLQLQTLSGYKIKAADGEIGKIKTVYFDDKTWVVRYLVVDTGNWLSENLVLLHPSCLAKPNRDTKVLPVSITQRKIQESPEISHDQPVSKQKLADLHTYYEWPLFWAGGLMAFAESPAVKRLENDNTTAVEDGDPHLRSAQEVMRYGVRATDGDLGSVYDFVIDTQNWNIRYIVVDTGNWLPGKKVLVSPHWINNVIWEDAVVCTTLGKDGVKNSPEYDPRFPLAPDYEEKLYQHYGRSLAREREKMHAVKH